MMNHIEVALVYFELMHGSMHMMNHIEVQHSPTFSLISGMQ